MTVIDTAGVPSLFRAGRRGGRGLVRAGTARSTRTRSWSSTTIQLLAAGCPGSDARRRSHRGRGRWTGWGPSRYCSPWCWPSTGQSPPSSARAGATAAAGGERPDHGVLAVPRSWPRPTARCWPRSWRATSDRLRGRELQPGHPDVLQGPVAVVGRRGFAAAVEPDPGRLSRRGGLAVPQAPAGDAALGAGRHVRGPGLLPGPGPGPDPAVRHAGRDAGRRPGPAAAAAEPPADGDPSALPLPGFIGFTVPFAFAMAALSPARCPTGGSGSPDDGR